MEGRILMICDKYHYEVCSNSWWKNSTEHFVYMVTVWVGGPSPSSSPIFLKKMAHNGCSTALDNLIMLIIKFEIEIDQLRKAWSFQLCSHDKINQSILYSRFSLKLIFIFISSLSDEILRSVRVPKFICQPIWSVSTVNLHPIGALTNLHLHAHQQ